MSSPKWWQARAAAVRARCDGPWPWWKGLVPEALVAGGAARHEGLHRAHGLARAGLGLDIGEERLELVADERLLLQQPGGDAVEDVAVLLQQPQRLLVGHIGQACLPLVAQALRLL